MPGLQTLLEPGCGGADWLPPTHLPPLEEFFEGTLKSAVKETVERTMKEVLSGKKEEEKKLSIQVKVKTSKDLLSEVRSIQGLVNRFPEFESNRGQVGKDIH